MQQIRRKILYLVTEDWFFASHFLPMARAAQEQGLDVTVVCRTGEARKKLEAIGATVIPFESARGSLSPVAMVRDIVRLAGLLRRIRPDLLHAIALRPVLTGGLAARLAGIERKVLAITGLGFLGAAQTAKARAMRGIIAKLLQALRGPRTIFLFENDDDPALLGLQTDSRADIALIGGAGVDPALFPPSPLPPYPLRIAIVSRMVWSKGIDIAVQAVGLARARGANVSLSLFGSPDTDNPHSFSRTELEAWSRQPGIQWHGPTNDVATVWRAHHLCCAPSRGGEGLPRTLLEAAACGRAILTTDVPGCRSFVRNDQEGWLVEPSDSDALAEAIIACAKAPDLVAQAGLRARQRFLSAYTQEHVSARIAEIYARLLPE